MVSLINWFTDEADGLDSNKTKSIVRILWFNKWFSVDMFEDLDKLIFLYIEFCSSMSIKVNTKSLDIFCSMELPSILKKIRFNFRNNNILPYIDYDMPRALETALPTIIEILKSQVQNLCEVPRGESFKSDVTQALRKEREERLRKVFGETAMSLSTSFDEAAVEKSKSKIKEIETKFSDECLKSLSIIEGEPSEVTEDESSLLFETGLPTLDEDLYGGISTSNVYAVVGQPKSGKTRFLCSLILNAICKGINVYFDSAEMSEFRIRNMLVSLYLYKDSIKGKVQTQVPIPDERMRLSSLSDAEKQRINGAREKLFGKNSTCGKLIINHNVTATTLKQGLQEAIELYNVQLYCLDYAGFVSAGDDKNLQKLAPFELISKIYKDVHDVVLNSKIGVIILNQFSKEGLDIIARSNSKNSNRDSIKELDSSCIEGGQAVGRTADYVLGLTTVSSETRLTKRKLSVILSRISAGFKNLFLDCNIGCSYFTESTKLGG